MSSSNRQSDWFPSSGEPALPKTLDRRGFLAKSAALTAVGAGAFSAAPAAWAAGSSRTRTGVSVMSKAAKEQLTVAVSFATPGFDPDSVAAGAAMATWNICYEGLTDASYTADLATARKIIGTPGYKPPGLLATKWTSSKSGRGWRFTINDKARSSFGNKLSVEDVVWSLRRPFGTKYLMSFFYGLIGLSDPSQIRAVNGTTVEIVLPTAPPPFFLFVFGVPWAGIYDAGEVTRHTTSDDPWGKAWLAKNTAGFGPYKLSSTNADGSLTTLDQNPYYWAKKERGLIPRQVHTFVPDTSNRLQLVLAGSADLADTLSALDMNQVSKSKNAKVVNVATAGNLWMGLDNSKPPFDDAAVRRAVALAIPYASIIKNVYLGRASRWRTFIPPQFEAAGDVLTFNTDAAAAKKALAKVAGAPVTLSYVAGDTTQENIVILVRQALQAAGLNVTAQAVPRAQFGVQKNGGQLQFWPDVVDSPAIPSSFYALAQMWIPKPIQQLTHYNQPLVQDAYDAGSRAKSIPARAAALLAAQKQLAKDMPSIPVCFTGTQVAAAKNLTGFRSLTTAAMCLSTVKWSS